MRAPAVDCEVQLTGTSSSAGFRVTELIFYLAGIMIVLPIKASLLFSPYSL